MSKKYTISEVCKMLDDYKVGFIRPGFYDLSHREAAELLKISLEYGFNAFDLHSDVFFAKTELTHDSMLNQRLPNETLEELYTQKEQLQYLRHANVVSDEECAAWYKLKEILHKNKENYESYEARRIRAGKITGAPETRQRIFARDGHKCKACDEIREDELTIDHIVSVKKGGGDEDDNLQVLCRRCNAAKGAA